MMPSLDVLIQNARLRKLPDLVDIAISDGQIIQVAPAIERTASLVLDAAGSLVSEPFANPHMHLDKVYTLPMMDEQALRFYHSPGMGRAMNAVEEAARIKQQYDRKWIVPNARRALALAALHGVLYLRTFADVDRLAGQEGLAALLELREEFKDILTLQVVAFAEDGIVREPQTTDLIRQSMKMGADVVGGHPFIELTDEDAALHIRTIFDIAQEFNADISMLVDDAGDPSLRQIEIMAVETIRRGWRGRVLAHHARAMSTYPEPYYRRLSALLRQADMGVVTNPHTGPLHTRVRDLLQDGIDVTLGQDDISDAYYPFGRNNMLEIAFLAAHLLWMTSRTEMETLYDMATILPIRRMGIRHPGIVAGAPADLVILGRADLVDAFRFHAPPRWVIRRGKLIDSEKMLHLAE